MKTEPDLSTIDHLDFDIPCDSPRCQRDWHLGDHPADYEATFTCGCTWFQCSARVTYTSQLMRDPARMARCPVCREVPVEYARLIPIRNQV